MAEIAKASQADLYPDVVAAGGLPQALQVLLDRLPGGLTASGLEKPFIVYAQVKRGPRSSQVMLAADHRAFSCDFWHQGVQYGQGWADSLDKVALAIRAFHIEGRSAGELRASFSWINVRDQAFLHEGGAAKLVEAAWQSTLQWLKTEPAESPVARLLPLVLACMERPRLRGLLPFTSLDRLCFSRTTGYPYTTDCPSAVWSEPDQAFRMHAPASGGVREFLGDAAAVAATMESTLPAGCGPALHGTANDLT
jgi:hypothetical protein